MHLLAIKLCQWHVETHMERKIFARAAPKKHLVFQKVSQTWVQTMTCISHSHTMAMTGSTATKAWNVSCTCCIYAIYIQHPEAKHQNLAGVTHPVALLSELLIKARQAGTNKALKVSNNNPQVMQDSLCRDGPSPAVSFSDGIHWRVWFVNAEIK